MSTNTMDQRPIFGAEEQNLLTPIQPPVSRLSIASLILGIVSCLALFNLDLVALPILSAAVSLAAYLFTVKNEGVRGQTIALLALGLSIVFGTACYTGNLLRDQYLYVEGAKVAEQFLNVVGKDKLMVAFELTRPEPERMVAGASLEQTYMSAPEPVKENIAGFKSGEGIQKVVKLGPSAEWKLDSGVRIYEGEGKSVQVSLLMKDQRSQKTVEVTMNRSYDNGIGSWNVTSVK